MKCEEKCSLNRKKKLLHFLCCITLFNKSADVNIPQIASESIRPQCNNKHLFRVGTHISLKAVQLIG